MALTGITLSLGVLTWVWSDIKFQADMGLLLTFMFMWNMVGAIVMIPALASLLVPQQVKLPNSASPQSDPLAGSDLPMQNERRFK